VLVKSDGSYTYFAPDIAYHLDKLERPAGTWSAGSPAGSEYLVNIWGADHHGYISRMQAAVTALGHDGKLTVVLGQLVNLYRGGEAVRMSKRTGEMVTFEELIEEVGSDATKYLMLSRSSDQPIDFDIEVAKKQDASNPVYYVQYAHARICSLLRKAGSPGAAQTQQQPLGSEQATRPAIDAAQAQQSSLGAIAKDNALAPGLSTAVPDLSLLVEETELALARELARLSEVVEVAARDLAPFRLTHYAHDLATAFHAFYTRCPVLTAKPALAAARLYLAEATQSVLALTLFLLGVSAPERM
jgi:arginyl-tRNA synthetase